jgi:hypothetical protein
VLNNWLVWQLVTIMKKIGLRYAIVMTGIGDQVISQRSKLTITNEEAGRKTGEG